MKRATLGLLMMSIGTAAGWAADEGTVILGPDAAPVQEGRVEIVSKPRSNSALASLSSSTWRTTTDDRGSFDLRLPTGRPLLLAIDHPDLRPYLRSVEAPLPPTIRLARGETLRGRITAPDRREWEGRACAEWESLVGAWKRRFDWKRCGPLSEDGRFEISGLPSRPVRVVVEAPGFLPAEREAAAGETLAVELERGTLIRGRVRSAHGEPVARATVRRGDSPGVSTDRKGWFELPVPSLPAVVRVESEGFSPADRRVRRLDPDRPLAIVLQPTQRLTGLVVSSTGSPLDRITLVLRRQAKEGKIHRSLRQVELEDGTFEIEIDRPGRYEAAVRSDGHRETEIPPFDLPEGREYDLGVVELSPGAVVRGRLLDHLSGESVPNARSILRPRGEKIFKALAEGRHFDAVSGSDGSFEIRGVESGDYELVVEAANRAPLRRKVTLERDEVLDLGDIHLERGTALHGRVVDRGGEPQSGVTVRFFDPGRQSLVPIDERVTKKDGSFSELSLSPGDYRVEVTRERLLLSQALTVPAREEHEVELVAGGVELRGVITRAGEPVAGGALVLDSELDPGRNGTGKVVLRTGGDVASSETVYGLPQASVSGEVRPDGTFFFPDAPSGRVEATYYDPGGPSVRRRVQIPSRTEAWIEIELSGINLSGRVMDRATGEGVAARVELLFPSGRVADRTTTDGEGTFRLRELEPGVYSARVQADGYRSKRVGSLEIRDDTEPLVVALEAADVGNVHVTLRREDQSPLAGVFVSVVDDLGSTVRSLLSDATGERFYDGLSPGRYHVVWSDAGTGVGVSRPLEVQSGSTERYRKTLPRGSSVTLACAPSVCGGRTLEHLLLFSAETGVELARFLQGIAAEARFTSDGRLPLGSLSPGTYIIHVRAEGMTVERTLEVPSDSDLVVRLGRESKRAAP